MKSLIPERVSNHPRYPQLLQAIRIIQFVSAIVSLGLFARYLANITTAISGANGAIIGILAAAVVWVVVITLIGCFVPLGGTLVKIFTLCFDTAFVGAFIAVASLSTPMGGRARAGQCTMEEDEDDNDGTRMMGNSACNLVTGTFALSIVSTFAHTLSGVMGQGNSSTPAKLKNPLSDEK